MPEYKKAVLGCTSLCSPDWSSRAGRKATMGSIEEVLLKETKIERKRSVISNSTRAQGKSGFRVCGLGRETWPLFGCERCGGVNPDKT
jgi:glutamate synthase domain-containing protein 1